MSASWVGSFTSVPERAMQVWDLLFAAGQDFGLEVGGYKVLDAFRLEKGYRYYTADVTPLENPYAAGLGFCVHLDKGDFIGREALLKAKSEGLRANCARSYSTAKTTWPCMVERRYTLVVKSYPECAAAVMVSLSSAISCMPTCRLTWPRPGQSWISTYSTQFTRR